MTLTDPHRVSTQIPRSTGGLATEPANPVYDPRRWKALPVVLAATFMSLFDIFVVNVAAPSIQHDLHASSSILEMVVAGYSFSYAAGLVTGARLGDLLGRRKMFTIGLGIFAVASLFAGISPDSAVLVAARLAQGFGAAAMIPQVLSLLTANFTPEERPRVFSFFGVAVGLGTVAGQILGGVLLHLDIFGWGWRPIFLINVPIGIVAILLARRLIPESRPDAADRLDPLGVVLLTGGVGALTAPLVLGQPEHWPIWTWVSFVFGSVLVAAFVWWEHRLGNEGGHPLLPLSLFEHRAFNSGLMVNFGFFAFFGSVLLTLTLFLQEGMHYSPMRAGLTFAPLGVAFALSSLKGRSLHAALRDRGHFGRSPRSPSRRDWTGRCRKGVGPLGQHARTLSRARHDRDRQWARHPPDRPGRVAECAQLQDGGRLRHAHDDTTIFHGARHRRSRHALLRT